jgi:PKD repeat protein
VGNPAQIGELSSITGQVIASGQAATAVTDGGGVARVRLSAPARTDILVNTTVLVAGRIVNDDANGGRYATVRVEIVPAEARLFPPNPGNDPPNCAFVVQPVKTSYGVGEQILFQAAASDPDGRIVRYEWDFGDGSSLDLKPDVNHAYTATGSYFPVLTVVDNNGATSFCGLAQSGSGLTAIVVK